MCQHINPASHSSPLIVVIISTQNTVVNKGHVEVYRTSVDELLQFHQLKRCFNHFDKFYLKAQKFPKFSMHECNAHFCVLSISSLTSWDVTKGKYHLGLTTNVVSDSCAVNYALTIRLGMGWESQLILLPFACQRTYHTGATSPLGCGNMGGTPQFPPVPGVFDGL
jgi:hypothetical protein